MTPFSSVSASRVSDPADHVQEIAGLDVEYGYGHFTFYGEGFLNRWEFSDEYGTDLEARHRSAHFRHQLLQGLHPRVPTPRGGVRVLGKLRGQGGEISTAADSWPSSGRPLTYPTGLCNRMVTRASCWCCACGSTSTVQSGGTGWPMSAG